MTTAYRDHGETMVKQTVGVGVGQAIAGRRLRSTDPLAEVERLISVVNVASLF